MKKLITTIFVAVLVSMSAFCFASCSDKPHKHNLEHFQHTAASCTENGNIEYWHCTSCGKYYADSSANTELNDNAWILNATGHNYVNHYCTVCMKAQPAQSLEDLVFFYEDDMIKAAKKINGNPNDVLNFEYEVCILDQNETIQFMQNYQLSPNIPNSEIERGLFVKCTAIHHDTQQIMYTAFFNYGLQLNKEYERLDVSTVIEYPGGSVTSNWYLQPLTENAKVFFEFSIIDVESI